MDHEGEADRLAAAGGERLDQIRGDIRGVIAELDRLIEDLRDPDPPSPH
jgi:hypothetical protein